MKIKIKFDTLLMLSAGLFIFLFSLYVAPFHRNGDQAHYLAAYEEMRGLNLNDGLMVYQSYLFTEEPIHFLISWFFSNVGMSKNITILAIGYSQNLFWPKCELCTPAVRPVRSA